MIFQKHADRLFIELGREEILDHDGLPILPHGIPEIPQQQWKHWDSAPCVILLGEPANGKTTEFTYQCKFLENSGEYVRFTEWHDVLEDEHLWNNHIHNEKRDELEKALSEGKTVWWFIDSLDEGRIIFKNALGKLGIALRDLSEKGLLSSLRLRLSCRIRDWKENDAEKIRKYFSHSDDVFRIIKILPLDKGAIRELAEEKLENKEIVDEFLQKIVDKKVIPLASQPLTLSFMLEEFKKNRTLDITRFALYEKAIEKLVEEINKKHRDRNAEDKRITNEQSRIEIAEKHAFISVFSLVDSFYIGDEDNKHHESFDSLLVDEDKRKILETLNTSMFKAIGQGRFSFINKSIAEFLSARFVAKKINSKEFRLRQVFSLFSVNNEIIPSALREVAGWVATSNQEFRQWLITVDPITALLGDMIFYQKEEREKIIEGLLVTIQSNPWLLYHSNDFTNLGEIARLVDENILINMLNKENLYQEQLLAISLISDAKREDLYPMLLDIAKDNRINQQVRKKCVKVLAKLAPEQYAEQLHSLVSLPETEDPEDEIAAAVLSTLYPKYMTTENALKGLRFPRNGIMYGGFKSFWKKYSFQEIPIADRELVLEKISTLFLSESSEYYIEADLKELYAYLLLQELRYVTSYTENIYKWVNIYTHHLRSREHRDYQETHNELINFIKNNIPLKEYLLEIALALHGFDKEINEIANFPYSFYECHVDEDFYMYIRFFEKTTKYPLVAKTFLSLALKTLFELLNKISEKIVILYELSIKYPVYKEQISYALLWKFYFPNKISEKIVILYELSIKYPVYKEQIFYALLWKFYSLYIQHSLQHNKEEKERETKKIKDKEEFLKKLNKLLPLIEKGNFDKIIELFSQLKITTDLSIETVLDRVLVELGEEACLALKRGLYNLWKNVDEKWNFFDSQNFPQKFYPYLYILTLNFVIKDPDFNWFNCSPIQIDIAIYLSIYCGYEPSEKFSSSFSDLIKIHSEYVWGRLELLLEKEAENINLQYPMAWHSLFYIMSESDGFSDRFREYVISSKIPSNQEVFKLYFRLTEINKIGKDIVDNKLAENCANYWANPDILSDEEEKSAVLVLAAWWIVNPKKALDTLEKINNGTNRKDHVIAFMASLQSLSNNKQTFYGLPSNIAWEDWASLFPFLYFKEVNDLTYKDGLVTPEQMFLNIKESIINIISQGETQLAYDFFCEIKNDERYKIHKDRFSLISSELERKLIDESWNPPSPSVLKKMIASSVFIINTEADFFNFMCHIIEEDLPKKLRSDHSLVPFLWYGIKSKGRERCDEKKLQQLLYSHICDLIDSYPIIGTRENEIFDEKKPDFSFSIILPNGQKLIMPCEVKWDTYRDKEEKIGSQLADIYIQKPVIQHGLFLVGWGGHEESKLSIQDMQTMLQDEADKIFIKDKKKVKVYVLDVSVY